VVVVNQDACTGCRSCFEVCPIHAPQFVSDGTKKPTCSNRSPHHVLTFIRVPRRCAAMTPKYISVKRQEIDSMQEV
jgi:Fe-S-cluster-containing dehydrogenase component